MTQRTILLTAVLALVLSWQQARGERLEGFIGETWQGYEVEDSIFNPNFGNGTQEHPWKIYGAEGLAYLAYKVNVEGETYEGKYFEIASHINLATADQRCWVPIGTDEDHCFQGTLTAGTYTDANGVEHPYEVRGMTIRADGTATTSHFGLFGVLQGTVEGLVVKNANITVSVGSAECHVGTLCGWLGTLNAELNSQDGGVRGVVTRCSVENAQTSVTTTNAYSSVGGLIGSVDESGKVESALAATTIRANGPLNAGGVFGDVQADRVLTDCHAVVTLTLRNDTDGLARGGGITGYCMGYRLHYTELMDCTASGDITATGSAANTVVGGITGTAYGLQKLSYCTTSVSLAGAHTMGGLIGAYDILTNAADVSVQQCFCASLVDARQATYAGGLFGRVSFSRTYSNGNYAVGYISNASVLTTFVGTMTKPEAAESRYGIIVGYVENDQQPDYFGFFRYDRKMCNLQLNGMGWDMSGRVGTISYPTPQDGLFAYYQEAWMGNLHQHLLGQEPFYTANMKVACAPFVITNDYQNYFNAYDVTIDFLVDKFVNELTGEELATYQLMTPAPSCLKLRDNRVTVLDPGEATVVVNCRGVQRKVHLDITYGQPWDGSMAGGSGYKPWDDFIGGDGTAKNPYVIHNAEELLRVMYNRSDSYGSYQYNVSGKHYVLSNDIFLNAHLLCDDEQPRSDAQRWTGSHYEWRATLHGNGKTVYGLRAESTEGGSHGLFGKVSGRVEDLAVVDSHVKVSGSDSIVSAGIICGELLKHGTIERCLAHGGIQSDGYAGGICGRADAESTRLADCFAAVHIGWDNQSNFVGAGITATAPEELVRCVSTGKVENSDGCTFGITDDMTTATDCWYDRQMMSFDGLADHPSRVLTTEMTGGRILAGNPAWTTAANRYPMLRQFARTSYGDLLSAPVFFAVTELPGGYGDIDRAGYVTEIFDLPTENITWRARLGNEYLDIINECGAGTPNKRTTSEPDHLIGETASTASLSTSAKRCIAVDVRADKAGIRFKDSHAETACLAAFDADGDGLVSLREAFTAGASQFATFNASAEAKNAESFTEMRYFAGITHLQEGMLSGLDKLAELELPKQLTTIGPNAFNGCAALENITLPYPLATANGESFYGSAIKNIVANERSTVCRSIDGVLYQIDPSDDSQVMLMAYPPGRGEEDATLTAPLTAILSKAVYRVPGLNNIYIDNCLPDGCMAELADPEDEDWNNYSDAIIHYDDDDDTDEPQMHIYVNDGSFNSSLYAEYLGEGYYWQPYVDNGHLDIYYPLNVTSALWATLYVDFPTELPEGLEAFIASEPDTLNNVVELNSIGRVIPRSVPVAIRAREPGLYRLYKHDGSVPDVEKWKNRFIGSFIGQDGVFGVPVNQETAVEGSMLTLGRNKLGEVGFFKYNGKEIPPYRAYLTRNNIIDGPTQLMIRLGDAVDGIEAVEHNQSTQTPAPRDGIYDLTGRKLSSLHSPLSTLPKGIYIINGKKVVIK